MLLKSTYDLIRAFGIVGGNRPFAIGTVKKQHSNCSPALGADKLSEAR
jgi:hypothetical protein